MDARRELSLTRFNVLNSARSSLRKFAAILIGLDHRNDNFGVGWWHILILIFINLWEWWLCFRFCVVFLTLCTFDKVSWSHKLWLNLSLQSEVLAQNWLIHSWILGVVRVMRLAFSYRIKARGILGWLSQRQYIILPARLSCDDLVLRLSSLSQWVLNLIILLQAIQVELRNFKNS
jgi:hypothetical protein